MYFNFYSPPVPDTLIVRVTCSEADLEKASFKIITNVSALLRHGYILIILLKCFVYSK